MNKIPVVARFLVLFLKLLLFTIVFLIVAAILGILISLLTGESIHSINPVLSVYAQLIAIFIVIPFFYYFLDHKKMADLGLSVRGHVKEFLAGSGIAVLIMITCFGILLLCNQIEFGVNPFSSGSFLLGLVLYIGVAIFEEVMCRGYLLGNLMDSMNKYVALFVSSIIFSVLHLFNDHISLIPIINLFLAGLLLGSAYIYTRNLWFPIGMHLFWNFTQGTVLGFNVSGHAEYTLLLLNYPENNWFNGGLFGLEGSLLITFFTSIAIFLVMKHYIDKNKANISEYSLSNNNSE
ncbi:MAG: CPBP family intramembrane metalloprotease [Tannerellaceae bacterium]|nr:CPBP family intramembrane metalloprotease [Tannerellaceae bacterium]